MDFDLDHIYSTSSSFFEKSLNGSMDNPSPPSSKAVTKTVSFSDETLETGLGSRKLSKTPSKYNLKRKTSVEEISMAVGNIQSINDMEGIYDLHDMVDASKKGDVDEINCMHEYGIDINTKLPDNLKTCLHLACEYGQIELVNYLLSLNADINVEDLSKKTPLHYACERGHLLIVKLMVGEGANVHQKNALTVLQSACKSGHLRVIQYLVLEVHVDVNGIDHKNRTAMHYATKRGNLKVIEFLVEHHADVDAKDSENMQPIHYACETKNLKLVKLLVSLGAKLDTTGGMDGTVPLLYACEHSNLEVVKSLIEEEGAKVHSVVDESEATALHYACHGGNLDIVKYLVEVMHLDVNVEDKLGQIPIFFAYKASHFAVIDYLLSKGSRVEEIEENGNGLVNLLAKELSKNDDYQVQRREIFFTCLKHNAIGKMDDIDATLYCVMETKDFSFIAYAFTKFLVHLESPITFLNTILAGNSSGDDSPLMLIVEKHLQEQDPMILFYLVQLIRAVDKASDQHHTERADLIDVRKKLEVMTNELFSSNSMDDRKNALKLIQPFDENESGADIDDLSLFEGKSVITYCIERNIATIFDKPQVSNLIERVFYSVPKSRTAIDSNPWNYHGYSFYTWSFYFLFDAKQNKRRAKNMPQDYESDCVVNQRKFTQQIKYTHSLRTNPAMIMFSEFLSKAVLLWLLAMVSINDYGSVFKTDFSRYFHDDTLADAERNYTIYEAWLIIFAVADIIFEMGQMIEELQDSFSMSVVVKDEWNLLDRISSSFLISWIVLRFIASHQLPAARIVLAIAAIPMSFGLLRYSCIYESLGELVILIKAMSLEILNVIIIYFLCILGFGITFYGLFYDLDKEESNLYSAPGMMVLTLFQNTLVNFDFDIFKTNNDSVNILGIILLVVFLILTAIVLMNLLIAQMSSSYEAMKEQCKQQWCFGYARLVAEYMLLRERHVFCMLPPPCNAFTIFLWPIHALSFCCCKFSFAGTFTNIVYSLTYGTIFRLAHYIHHFKQGLTRILPERMERKRYILIVRILLIISYFVTTVIFIIIDILLTPWVILGIELFSSSLATTADGQNPKYSSVYLYLEYVDKDWNIIYSNKKTATSLRSLQSLDQVADDNLRDERIKSSLSASIDSDYPTSAEPKEISSGISPMKSIVAVAAKFALREEYPGDAFKKMLVRQSSKSSNSEKALLFKENDILRILRPLKSYIKSLSSNELLRLESNVSQETLRLRNDIHHIIEDEMHKVIAKTSSTQDTLKNDILVVQSKVLNMVQTQSDGTKSYVHQQCNKVKSDVQGQVNDLEKKMKSYYQNDILGPQTIYQQELAQSVATNLNDCTTDLVTQMNDLHGQLAVIHHQLDNKMTSNDENLKKLFSHQLNEVQGGLRNETLQIRSHMHVMHEKVTSLETRMTEMESSIGEILDIVRIVAASSAATAESIKSLAPSTPTSKKPTSPSSRFSSKYDRPPG